MSNTLSVRLNTRQRAILDSLYEQYHIVADNEADRFRKLLNEIATDSSALQSNTSSLELLEGWDCSFRAVIQRWDKHLRGYMPFVHCSAMNTRKVLGTNVIDIAVCKKCNDRGSSSKFVSLPQQVKQEKPTIPSKPVVQPRRKCACGTDISHLEDWKTQCISCWRKSNSKGWQGDNLPLRGSPLDLRMREAERLRKLE